jgi:hypothetical protein
MQQRQIHTNRLEASRLASLSLQLAVQLLGVLAHIRGGLAHGAKSHHQPGCVPGGSGRDLLLLKENNVLHAHLC